MFCQRRVGVEGCDSDIDAKEKYGLKSFLIRIDRSLCARDASCRRTRSWGKIQITKNMEGCL